MMKKMDFVLLFDCTNGNPNGDPDANNLPRTDPETNMGLVTDVCLKRKIRNYVEAKHGDKSPYRIFVKERAVLNSAIAGAYSDLSIDLNASDRKEKGKGVGEEVDKAREFMCKNYYDVRTFGAVMSTGANAGQVRGAVQMTFSQSLHPIIALEHSITRVAVATDKESERMGGQNKTMGRKYTIPYGLYRAHGFVVPAFAEQTGFSDKDCELFWEAVINMFENDRSAARGFMAVRGLYVFEHLTQYGTMPAQDLFKRIKIMLKDETNPPRSFEDYTVEIDEKGLRESIKLIRKVG